MKWLKLHTDIRNNWKVSTISHVDRWVYICLLTMEADGALEHGATESWQACQCGLDLAEFRRSVQALMEADLLTDEGRIRNFQARQYSDIKSAKRSQKYRDRKKAERDASRDASRVTETLPDTETETDSESEADADCEREPNGSLSGCLQPDHAYGELLPVPASKTRMQAKPNRILESQVDEVIHHFRSVTGKTKVQVNAKANRQHIRARLQEGVRVDDLKAVVDLKTSQVKQGKFKDQYLRIETLFNATKCHSYLAELDAVQEGAPVSKRTQANMAALESVLRGSPVPDPLLITDEEVIAHDD